MAAVRRRGGSGRRAAGDPAAGVRVRGVPGPAAGDHRPRRRRRRRARADADRRRQVAVLPDPRARPGRHRRGHLPAHRADAGPGGRADRAGRAGRVPQLDPGGGRAAAGRGSVPGGRAGPAVPGAGAAAGRIGDAAARPRPDLAVRDRRGALRGPVGARLPARLPRTVRAARAVAGRAADRPDRDGDQGHPGRDRHPAQPGWRAPLRLQLRPAEHLLPDRAEERAAPAAAGPAARGAPGRRPASCTACPGRRWTRRPSS